MLRGNAAGTAERAPQKSPQKSTWEAEEDWLRGPMTEKPRTGREGRESEGARKVLWPRMKSNQKKG